MFKSLYIQRKVLNADQIIEWAHGQGFRSTLKPEDMHVTIAYSRQLVNWKKIGPDLFSNGNGELCIIPDFYVIEEFSDGAIVLRFADSSLEYRHEEIKKAGASWDFPDYNPHVTITYDKGDMNLEKVKPYSGSIILGPELFNELDEDWKEDNK